MTMSHLEFAIDAGEDVERDVNGAGPKEAMNGYFQRGRGILRFGLVRLGWPNSLFCFSIFICSVSMQVCASPTS